MNRNRTMCAAAAGLAATMFLLCQPMTARAESLYNEADPDAPGGIRGTIAVPALPLEKILAVPADDPVLVYEGIISGPDRRSFLFEGLPMRRYDLLAIYEDRFYEGFALHRGAGTLTDADRAEISRRIQESEPFFTHKIVHRLEGETGRGGKARAVCTYLRDKGSIQELEKQRSEHRRTFKLVMLQQVGPGWQIVRARDLYPIYTQPERNRVPHFYRDALNRIRVTDDIKDLGTLTLGGAAASTLSGSHQTP